ncbi:heavy metal-binding domain-containing protein [Vibrio sp. WXL210]|uniref:heavy metal-binding domain-containing protein n=1 Tax=Vibrio sp. WXL210 TaxID=3450709 RepID=UPI003EC68102
MKSFNVLSNADGKIAASAADNQQRLDMFAKQGYQVIVTYQASNGSHAIQQHNEANDPSLVEEREAREQRQAEHARVQQEAQNKNDARQPQLKRQTAPTVIFKPQRSAAQIERENLIRTMPTSTTAIEGEGEVVTTTLDSGTNLFRDIFASLRDIFGGKNHTYMNKLDYLKQEANSGGGKSMLMVTVTATAIKRA